MGYKRTHFIETDDGWIMYFCDTVRYKKINNEEKQCCDYILQGKTKKQYCSDAEHANETFFEECQEALIDHEERASVIPEEKLRLTLNVANACNMNCGYCYANGGTYHSKENLMPLEVAEKAIDLFVKKFGEIGSIKFIGGEPLLNKKAVCGVCDYVWQKYDEGTIHNMPDFIIATNGTILDDKLIEYSIRYNWRVGLSFDGPESIHEIVRKFRDGTTTVSAIKNNIQKWKKATGGRCPSSVNACFSGIHQQHGVKVTDAIRYIKEELGIEKVNIVPVDASKDSSFALTDNECFTEAIQEILDYDSDNYRRYMFSKLKKMEKMLRSHSAMPAHVCKAGLTTFGISTKGSVSPCHMLTDENGFYMGNVEDENLFGSESFLTIQNKLKEYNRYENPKCKNCFANRLCIGCLGGNEFRTGDPYISDSVVCSMIRGAIEELLKDITREENGEEKNNNNKH